MEHNNNHINNKVIAKILIEKIVQEGVDPLTIIYGVFNGPQEIVDFFGNDIEWMPENLKQKIRRMIEGKAAFGM